MKNSNQNKCDNCNKKFIIESWKDFSYETGKTLNNINFCSRKCLEEHEVKLRE